MYIRRPKAENSPKVLKIRRVQTSHCGLVATPLSRKAGGPGSIPGDGKFEFSPDCSDPDCYIYIYIYIYIFI